MGANKQKLESAPLETLGASTYKDRVFVGVFWPASDGAKADSGFVAEVKLGSITILFPVYGPDVLGQIDLWLNDPTEIVGYLAVMREVGKPPAAGWAPGTPDADKDARRKLEDKALSDVPRHADAAPPLPKAKKKTAKRMKGRGEELAEQIEEEVRGG